MTREIPPVPGRKPNQRQRRLWQMHDFTVGRGLEIGPLHNRLMYQEQADVRYVDVFDRAQLVKNYANHQSVKKENIPEVDFPLWDGERVRSIPEAIGDTGPYDWVLAAHVIEHVPDIIDWLDQIAQVTVEGGKLFLLVPDRRYCFDIHRPGSTIGQMLLEHELGQTVPSVRAVYDHKRGAVEVDKADAWRGRPPGYAARKNSLPSVMKSVDRARKGEYVDAHVWTFTSGSLHEQIIELRELGLCEWKVTALRPTPQDEVEFYIVLERLPRGRTTDPELLADEVRPKGDMPDWLRQTSAFQRNLDDARKKLKRKDERIAELKKELARTRRELKQVRSSRRWRIGGVVTAPARLLRRR